MTNKIIFKTVNIRFIALYGHYGSSMNLDVGYSVFWFLLFRPLRIYLVPSYPNSEYPVFVY